MSQIPKLKSFQTPENYFEELPEKILAKAKRRKPIPAWTWAAAAVVLLGVGLWQAGGIYEEKPVLVSPEAEALLYIESEQWSTEDVLSLSEDPNALLDQIIEEEYAKTAPLWTEEETWF
ncbi:MAG: hypothetical protein FJX97_04130 [Bacteroidetes bacterium]|nr:hypothetical protein [Bacteroidota bacterium]